MTAERDEIDQPVRPVDVGELRRQLVAVRTLTSSVLGHLDDLETLAYDIGVGERAGGGGRKGGGFLTDVGDRRAKVALDRVHAAASAFAKALGDAERVVTAGPGADESLRGTMLGSGDGKTHPADAHAQLLKAQSRRRERGEYEPTRVVDQPRPRDGRKRKGKR